MKRNTSRLTGYNHGGLVGRFLNHKPSIVCGLTVVLMSGLYLEDCYGSEWFTRSGAAITILSLFAARQTYLSQRVDKHAKDFMAVAEDAFQRSPHDALQYMLKIGLVDQGYVNSGPLGAEILARFEFELRRLKRDETREHEQRLDQLNYTALLAAGVGTLVWAFGDLVATPIVDMTEWSCQR